jgi:hypothetical protein
MGKGLFDNDDENDENEIMDLLLWCLVSCNYVRPMHVLFCCLFRCILRHVNNEGYPRVSAEAWTACVWLTVAGHSCCASRCLAL